MKWVVASSFDQKLRETKIKGALFEGNGKTSSIELYTAEFDG